MKKCANIKDITSDVEVDISPCIDIKITTVVIHSILSFTAIDIKITKHIMNGTFKKSDPIDITNIIPPKLIKNYEVIVIVKSKEEDNTDDNPEETNLIDFDAGASIDKIILPKQSDTEESKKELSIIDLYEDITVNPLNLQLQKKSVDIFDPLELKSFTNDGATAKIADAHDSYEELKHVYEHRPSTSTSSDCQDYYDKTNYFKHRNDRDDEDFIDELVSDINHRLVIYNDKRSTSNDISKINGAKNLDVLKFIRTENKIPKNNKDTKNDVCNADYELPKIIRTKTNVFLPPDNKPALNQLDASPKLDINKTKQNLFEIPKPKTQTTAINSDMPKDLGVIQQRNRIEDFNLGNITQIILPCQSLQHSLSREKIRQYIDNLLRSKTVFCSVLKYYNPIDFYASSHTNELVFIVDTVPKDKKKYRKRAIIDDEVLANYTKGPNLAEKKLVLPRIMDRLVEKKKRMEKYAHCKRKLVLDCGTRRTEIPVQCNPTVLTEDCNKERLRDLLMRQNFENFVRRGQL
ncbi:uncharacterized protein LOC128682148 [Plodia interpunctella]|uniref:uncharacterized protein LOC128682148 n=1 Tax=Plodia interpunctella TaxID=58824 RepID=UPI0023680A71|nr:uncharacterized protein LOC128682148 [Plodia interpunctella]